MSVIGSAINVSVSRRDRLRKCGSAALTYGLGLWIVLYNPAVASQVYQPPIDLSRLPYTWSLLLGIVFFIVGRTPSECLIRVACLALIVQLINVFSDDEEDEGEPDLEHYRPYVFWQALYKFLRQCIPFLKNQNLTGPPSTALTEYERITVRYLFVRLIFLPMMICFFYRNLQQVIGLIADPFEPTGLTSPVNVRHIYHLFFGCIMGLDIAWFATGISMETGKYSPIKMVDPYASGWLAALLCYPPLSSITSQYIVWRTFDFPEHIAGNAVYFFAAAGMILYTIYVISEISFGLKTGNLTYRGLVEKGPYRWVRHPMYASKNTAWLLFLLPSLQLHWHRFTLSFGPSHLSIPVLVGNYAYLWPMFAWMFIYTMRALTEERYLLQFPEYREYCTRVRYRFIPKVI